jgi:hypothetical protein
MTYRCYESCTAPSNGRRHCDRPPAGARRLPPAQDVRCRGDTRRILRQLPSVGVRCQYQANTTKGEQGVHIRVEIDAVSLYES